MNTPEEEIGAAEVRFGKIVDNITGSSLMEEPLEVRYVFLMCLALAFPKGKVRYTRRALARVLNVSDEAVHLAAKRLTSPDPTSRSRLAEGRRWLLLDPKNEDGGWIVVNYEHYHGIAKRRKQWAESKRRARSVDTVDIHKTPQPDGDLDLDGDLDAEKSLTSCSEPSSSPNGEPPFIELPSNRNGHPVPIERSLLDEWSSLYPGVDVPGQLRAMRGWLLANPTKRKTANGMLRFVNAWLSREQNRSSGAPVSAPASSISPEAQEGTSRVTALTRIVKDESEALLYREANPEAGKQARERINELVAGIGKGGGV